MSIVPSLTEKAWIHANGAGISAIDVQDFPPVNSSPASGKRRRTAGKSSTLLPAYFARLEIIALFEFEILSRSIVS